MSIPLISIIVPIYNTDKYLSNCLDALINQTFHDIEIICVNDGSTDNSEKVAKEYVQKDNRIRYIYQENQGLSLARNTGIKASKAPYLMFCDSDDWYDATMCEKMYQAITKNDVDFACCGIQMEYEIENPTSEKADKNYYRVKYDGVVPVTSELLSDIDVSSCNKIMKKELLDKYNIRYPDGLNYEDYCLFFQLLSVSKNIYCLPKYLYHYRRHNNSIMVSTFAGDLKAIDHLKIMLIIYDFLIKNNLWDKWEKAFYNSLLASFYFSYTYLPKDKKDQAFDVAIPFMKNFSQEKIDTLLSEDKKIFWHCILNKICFPEPYVKKIKIGGITIIKIKQKKLKYTVLFLGLQIFSKKQKKNKEKFYVLYIPIFKRKIKNA